MITSRRSNFRPKFGITKSNNRLVAILRRKEEKTKKKKGKEEKKNTLLLLAKEVLLLFFIPSSVLRNSLVQERNEYHVFGFPSENNSFFHFFPLSGSFAWFLLLVPSCLLSSDFRLLLLLLLYLTSNWSSFACGCLKAEKTSELSFGISFAFLRRNSDRSNSNSCLPISCPFLTTMTSPRIVGAEFPSVEFPNLEVPSNISVALPGNFFLRKTIFQINFQKKFTFGLFQHYFSPKYSLSHRSVSGKYLK